MRRARPPAAPPMSKLMPGDDPAGRDRPGRTPYQPLQRTPPVTTPPRPPWTPTPGEDYFQGMIPPDAQIQPPRTLIDDIMNWRQIMGRKMAPVLGHDYDEMQALADRGVTLGIFPALPRTILNFFEKPTWSLPQDVFQTYKFPRAPIAYRELRDWMQNPNRAGQLGRQIVGPPEPTKKKK